MYMYLYIHVHVWRYNVRLIANSLGCGDTHHLSHPQKLVLYHYSQGTPWK